MILICSENPVCFEEKLPYAVHISTECKNRMKTFKFSYSLVKEIPGKKKYNIFFKELLQSKTE